MTGISDTLQ